MNLSHIAIPYAKALFDLSIERNSLDEAYHDMKLVAELCHTNRDFRMMLKSPVVGTEKKTKIIHAVFDNVLSKLSLTFFIIILRKKRESIIPDLAAEFIELYKDHMGILTTHMQTAVALTAEVREKVVSVLKDQTQKEIELVEEVKEEIIGGFILRWKDLQYDASVVNQINRLKKGIASINLYVKGL
jgi:F-type H+-transporting ATPase subunit delta